MSLAIWTNQALFGFKQSRLTSDRKNAQLSPERI